MRAGFTKRLLFRLLLTALLFVTPLLTWVRFPVLWVFADEGSTRTEATDETFADDAEWDGRNEEARPASRARLRLNRRSIEAPQEVEHAAPWLPDRFLLVVDVRRIKPKRLFAPPYLRPRVVRLLS